MQINFPSAAVVTVLVALVVAELVCVVVTEDDAVVLALLVAELDTDVDAVLETEVVAEDVADDVAVLVTVVTSQLRNVPRLCASIAAFKSFTIVGQSLLSRNAP
jgi:hypothetical protein